MSIEATLHSLLTSGDLTEAGAQALRGLTHDVDALTDTVEKTLQNEWHSDHCGCLRYPIDCWTYPFTHDDPSGWRRHAPTSFDVEIVAKALLPLVAG